MALINCKYCGHRISDKARACPKCGAAVLTQCSELDNTVQTSQIDQSTSHTQQETMKELSLEQNQFVESLQCSQPIEQQESTGDLPQEQEQFVELPKHAQPEEQEQPQTIQTDSESQDVEYESEQTKGLRIGLICGVSTIILAIGVVLFLFIPQLRFWEVVNKGDLLEIAYKEGYNCGKQFGSMTRCDELSNYACSTYISEVEKNCDYYQEFKAKFIQGMEIGVSESSYKYYALMMENITGTFSGNVGVSKIRMSLTCSNRIVDGSYSYTEINNILYLAGQVVNSDILLDETTPKGNKSATWTLRVTDDGLQGSMYVYHTGQTHEVALTRID